MKSESILSELKVNYLPNQFTIAAHTFTVLQYKELYNEEGEPIYGLFDYDNLAIKIRIYSDSGKQLSESIILNTYYHELMHSFNYLWNNECDESLASVFGLLMCEYLQSANYEKEICSSKNC